MAPIETQGPSTSLGMTARFFVVRLGDDFISPPCFISFLQFSRFGGFVAFVDLVPVDYIPPCGQVFGTPVVVLQVVSVLPDVVTEHWREALRHWVVLIGRAEDLQVPTFCCDPGPA